MARAPTRARVRSAGRRRLTIARLRHERSRTVTVIAAVAVATAAFTVLTGAADTSKVVARHTIAATGPSAYDILVRPHRSQSPIERDSGQVRPGFLDGVFGGISLAQWHQISAIPGVALAAPVAVVGYALQNVIYSVTLPPVAKGTGRQLFEIATTATTDRGLSHITTPPSYAFVTRHRLRLPPASGTLAAISQPVREVEPGGRLTPVCNEGELHVTNAYDADARNNDICISLAGHQTSPPTTTVTVALPLLIEAIDPTSEAKLDGLNHSIVDGRYLKPSDSVGSVKGTAADLDGPTFPVLVSSRNYLDDSIGVAIRRLSPAAAASVLVHRLGLNDNASRGTGPVVARRQFGIGAAYQQVVGQLRGRINRDLFNPIDGLWRVQPTGFRPDTGNGPVQPVPATPPVAPNSVWRSHFQFSGYVGVPPDNLDTSYRAITEHVASNGVQVSLPAPVAVGEFDPDKIEPFNPLTHVPLGGYEPTPATPADSRSVALLHGQDLLPNSNLTGYLGQPPQLVTTLAALPALESSQVFSGRLNPRRPISAIRIRVAGVNGVGALSRARVNLVAQDIIERTGLQVDITTGSSPSTRVTDLPAGRFGRPALELREGWVDKGVALQILRAVDRKSLLLFILVLVVCGLFVLNATTAAVRARRQQLGVLACLGWSPAQLFGDVTSEQAIVGAAAGVLGVAVAVPIAASSGLHVTAARVGLAVGAATVLTVLAALPPALAASRARPLEAVRPTVGRFRRHRPVHGLTGLAVRNVLRGRTRSLVAVLGLAFGVASSIFLLAVTTSFNGQIAGDLLGEAVTVRVRGVDYAAVAVMVAIGVIGIADVLYLNVKERAVELAALQAGGWSRRTVARLIAVEGAGLGLAGALLGVAAGLVLTVDFTSESLRSASLLSSVALVAGVGLGAVAAALPVRLLPRRLAESLADE